MKVFIGPWVQDCTKDVGRRVSERGEVREEAGVSMTRSRQPSHEPMSNVIGKNDMIDIKWTWKGRMIEVKHEKERCRQKPGPWVV